MDTEQAWFGPKQFGYGVSPRTWQGWAVTGAYGVLLVGMPRLAFYLFGRTPTSKYLSIGIVVLLTAGFCILASKKYDPRRD